LAHEALLQAGREKPKKQKIMKLNKVLLVAGFAAVLALGTSSVFAQGGPGGGGPGGQGGGPGGMRFDPAQMRKFMMDNYREQLGVKDDGEWKLIETQISKVMDARMEIGFGGGPMGMRPRRNNNNGETANANASGNQNRPRNPFGTQNAAAEALQKAIDAKAPSAEIKAKLDAYRADIKAKEEKLAKAQEELKKILTPEQEAIAVLGGLLK
jgi:Spy/CpxP family protein refolding chaperone